MRWTRVFSVGVGIALAVTGIATARSLPKVPAAESVLKERGSRVVEPILFHDFSNGMPDWKTYDSDRLRKTNTYIENGLLTLETNPYGTEWRGGSIICPLEQTYGRYQVRVRADAALYTKALLMLWPVGDWPPEIDFLEMGGTDNWDRHQNALAVHYDPDNKIVHRVYTADMTQWHTVAVVWRADTISFRLDGQVMPNLWGSSVSEFPNPGANTPMKLHITYWPTKKDPTDPWPEQSSKMQVQWVKIFA